MFSSIHKYLLETNFNYYDVVAFLLIGNFSFTHYYIVLGIIVTLFILSIIPTKEA